MPPGGLSPGLRKFSPLRLVPLPSGLQGRATFQLSGGVQAPARARQIVTVTIGVVLPEAVAYQASLLTSEIVSNSVVHGRAGEDDEIELALSWNVDRVRLEITDEGPGFQVSTPDPERPGGWGLPSWRR